MNLSSKEKKEIGIIVAAVLLVGMVGIITNYLEPSPEMNTGAAIKLDPNSPSFSGVLVVLRDYCSITTGSGDCNQICAQKTCIPMENNCNEVLTENTCWCCAYP